MMIVISSDSLLLLGKVFYLTINLIFEGSVHS